MKQEMFFDLPSEKQGIYQIIYQFFEVMIWLNPCNFKGLRVSYLTKTLTNFHALNTSLNVDTA